MKLFKNILLFAFIGLFFVNLSFGMVSSGQMVAMNEGKHVLVSDKDSATLWTDELKGCVVTILDIEYINGQNLLALSHYSHDKKSANQRYLETLLSHLEHKSEDIKHASCTIIPPGIKNVTGHLTPVIDPEWKDMIIHTVRRTFPTISFDIKPYLFNVEESAVTYVMRENSKKITILNKSNIQDLKNQSLLLICHNFKETPLCQRILPPLLTITALCGYVWYQMH